MTDVRNRPKNWDRRIYPPTKTKNEVEFDRELLERMKGKPYSVKAGATGHKTGDDGCQDPFDVSCRRVNTFWDNMKISPDSVAYDETYTPD